jgi:hypothetical protein
LAPEEDSLDVVAVGVVDRVDGLGLGGQVLLQDEPTLLKDDGLDVRLPQEDEVTHLENKKSQNLKIDRMGD